MIVLCINGLPQHPGLSAVLLGLRDNLEAVLRDAATKGGKADAPVAVYFQPDLFPQSGCFLYCTIQGLVKTHDTGFVGAKQKLVEQVATIIERYATQAQIPWRNICVVTRSVNIHSEATAGRTNNQPAAVRS